MLAIRMQRTGRKGHAMFRVIVQEALRQPTSGKVVAYIGSYDPHSKQLQLDKEKAAFYLSHGAQPSDRAARLMAADGVEMPKWVKLTGDKQRDVRNADKRRSTAPKAEEPKEEVAEAPESETVAEDAPAEEAASADAPAAEAEETPAE
jgi:small subunit ribosomal protein S16